MSWHYRIQKKWTVYKGKKQPFYCIVEYYRRSAGIKKPLWSRDPEWPYGETPKEVIKALEMMLKDAKKYRPFSDKSAYLPLLNKNEWKQSFPRKAAKGDGV